MAEYLSVKEAAAHIGVNAETIRRWIDKGAVPCTRFGPQHLIRLKISDLVSAKESDNGTGVEQVFRAL